MDFTYLLASIIEIPFSCITFFTMAALLLIFLGLIPEPIPFSIAILATGSNGAYSGFDSTKSFAVSFKAVSAASLATGNTTFLPIF